MSRLNNLSSSSVREGFEGFNDLMNELKEYIKSAENVEEILEIGAESFVKDLGKLTKPISEIKKGGYTHLIDSFALEKNKSKKEVVVGWGKYYGRMVELGTKKMDERPHMYPLWDRNKNKYYKLMVSKFNNRN